MRSIRSSGAQTILSENWMSRFGYLNWWVQYCLATIICRWRLLSQYSVALSSLKLNESRYCVRLIEKYTKFLSHILICYVRSSIKICRSWNSFDIVNCYHIVCLVRWKRKIVKSRKKSSKQILNKNKNFEFQVNNLFVLFFLVFEMKIIRK